MGLSGVLGIDFVSSPAVDVLASGEYLPFRDASFQLVFAGEVIEHLREPLRALKEWVRVLKDEGRIVISTPNGLHVAVHGGNPEHRRMFAPNDLSRTIQRLEVDVIYAKGIFTSLIPGRRLFRWIPFDSVKMALLRLPVPLSLSYDVFIAGTLEAVGGNDSLNDMKSLQCLATANSDTFPRLRPWHSQRPLVGRALLEKSLSLIILS